ncbi:MAG: NAD(P)/FAD-dependent oxidoreductase, partial [Thermosulfidibacteraceae bacterium]
TYCGIKGVIVERGCKVEDRVVKVEKLWNEGILDEDCNCQFGEGGAGTFSDGKLTTRIKDDFVGFVLREFVKFGAPENILFDSKPHIGTDYVRLVVRNIREFLLKSGWEIYYGTKVKDIEVNSGRIKAVLAENLRIEGTHFIFSIGNSARDTFNMLIKRGIAMTSKPFAIGFRIEHPQAFIDRNQYGKFHIYLPPASYNLSHHFKEANRGVYTFCMCPGGYIICVSSESGSVVTNGMSYYKRDSGYANSAIVVTVDKRDYGSDPLGGVEFQRGIERLAFKMSGGYYAISQKAIDFVKSKETRGDLKTTYRPATVTGDLSRLFKEDLVAFLRKGLVEFDRRIKGFVEKGILVGPETRTSSPIRILRDEKRLHSVSCENLFPVGEGSGYAGGIMSSVIDGFKAVISILGVGE